MSSTIAGNPTGTSSKPASAAIHRDVGATAATASSVVAAGPGAAEAAIIKKRDDQGASNQH